MSYIDIHNLRRIQRSNQNIVLECSGEVEQVKNHSELLWDVGLSVDPRADWWKFLKEFTMLSPPTQSERFLPTTRPCTRTSVKSEGTTPVPIDDQPNRLGILRLIP